MQKGSGLKACGDGGMGYRSGCEGTGVGTGRYRVEGSGAGVVSVEKQVWGARDIETPLEHQGTGQSGRKNTSAQVAQHTRHCKKARARARTAPCSWLQHWSHLLDRPLQDVDRELAAWVRCHPQPEVGVGVLRLELFADLVQAWHPAGCKVAVLHSKRHACPVRLHTANYVHFFAKFYGVA